MALPSRDLNNTGQWRRCISQHLRGGQPSGGGAVPDLRVLVGAPAVRGAGRRSCTSVIISRRKADYGGRARQIKGWRVEQVGCSAIPQLALCKADNRLLGKRIRNDSQRQATNGIVQSPAANSACANPE